MSLSDHIKIYTAEDFERYYSGSMNEQDMHALEKAALSDPFLSDALEGYANTGTASRDISAIRVKLDAKVQEKKNLPAEKNNSFVLRVAATIIFLALPAYFLMQRTDDQTLILAKNEKPASASQEQSGIKPIPAPGNVQDKDNASINNENNPEQTTTVSPEEKDVASNSNTVSPEDQTSPPFTGIATENEMQKSVEASSENIIIDANTKFEKRIQGLQQVSGKIIDEQGNAIPYATVTNNDKRVTADANGHFKIPAKDSIVFATISATGYDSKSLNMNTGPSQTIVLNDGNKNLNEVVVSGISKTAQKKLSTSAAAVKAKDVVAQNIHTNAVPVAGWQHFRDYIAANRKQMNNESGNKISGKVILSFKVNASGKPVRISIRKSLSAAYDNEAKRLLENGPVWKKPDNWALSFSAKVQGVTQTVTGSVTLANPGHETAIR